MEIYIKDGLPQYEDKDIKSDEENLKDGLACREELETWGYGKRERVERETE